MLVPTWVIARARLRAGSDTSSPVALSVDPGDLVPTWVIPGNHTDAERRRYFSGPHWRRSSTHVGNRRARGVRRAGSDTSSPVPLSVDPGDLVPTWVIPGNHTD